QGARSYGDGVRADRAGRRGRGGQAGGAAEDRGSLAVDEPADVEGQGRVGLAIDPRLVVGGDAQQSGGDGLGKGGGAVVAVVEAAVVAHVEGRDRVRAGWQGRRGEAGAAIDQGYGRFDRVAVDVELDRPGRCTHGRAGGDDRRRERDRLAVGGAG